MSNSQCKLLVVEDQPDDFHLLEMQIRDAGVSASCERVDSESSLREALAQGGWDAILSDYNLPGFSGLRALEIVKETGLDIPFIFVSGTIGEESAVMCMKAGAQDLVFKGQSRVVPVLQREIHESRIRRAHRTSELRYQRIIEQVSEGIWMTDAHGQVVFVNCKMADVLRCKPEDLVGRALIDLVAPASGPDLARLLTPNSEELNNQKPGASPNACALPVEFQRWDGQKAETLVTVNSLEEGGFLGTLTDVTDLRNLERRLIHSQKMEAIGRLAAGVAHDFNNTLSIISGFAELLMMDLVDPELTQIAQEIKDAAGNSTTMIRQMLAVGRQQEVAPRVLDLNQCVREHQRMLRKAAGDSIELQIRTDADPSIVEMDPSLLSQILLNLTINARDALAGGSNSGRAKIVVGTQYLVLDSEAAFTVNRHLPRGPYVILAVTDNGHGMDEETRQQIFEPFFTTKGPGKGTGLGLSSVYGMVRQSGGYVWVYSEPGFGSTFKVYLPAKTTKPRSGVEQTAAPQGDFTVLVVDDSDPTRQVMKRCLQRDGYNLLEAHDGEQAVIVSENFPGTIELAICDITMPGMTGPDAARLLRRQRPRIKILFTSGQGGEFCELPDPAEFPHTFVEKPVVPTALLSRVRALLAGV